MNAPLEMKSGPKRPLLIWISAAVVCGALLVAWLITAPPDDLSARLERIHGIHLPATATSIQSRGDAWHGFLDRGEATVFEMQSADLAAFVGQLKVNFRNPPARKGPADPTLNGWNVWPIGAKSFVPGNPQYGGFHRTWSGDAIPVEMLSCSSPTGDSLHVKYWKLEGDTMVVKMFTNWN